MISIGLDVGKERDPAALSVLLADGLRPNSHRPRWRALNIGNVELGTSYQLLADTTVNLANDYRAAGYPVVVTVDATGVGAPVLELMRSAAPELHIVAITISSGRTLRLAGPDHYVVGKHRLTEMLQVALEQRGLELPEGTTPQDELYKQIAGFRKHTNPSGYERHEAEAGEHDDLVLSTELSLWTGDTMHDEQAGVVTA